MKFNINDTVRVRLTDYGRAVLREDWQSTTNIYYARPEQRAIRGEYKPPKEDANGWSEWQLWALMEAFGEHTGNGCRLSFETEIEISSADFARVTAERDALAAQPDPLADYQEQVASIVYAAMRFAREDVTPEWQAGNSHAEYRARQAATEIAEMLRDALAAEVAALKPQSNADAAPIPLKSWVIEVFQHLCHSPHTPDSWKRDLDKKTNALLNAIEQGKESKP